MSDTRERAAGFQYLIDGSDLLDLLAEASFVIGFLGGDDTMPLSDRARTDMAEIANRLRVARDRVLTNQKAVVQ